MAILATIKSGAGKIAGKVANKGGNIVAKASGLSSAQLEKIEEKRNAYLMEKPETDPESIERLLGSYAIEAYEAYLPQLSELYKPMFIGEADDERSLDNRIRYFEVTKWVTDPTEDNLDKLTNMYHVLSEENCNIALSFNRRVSGTTVYFAVVNNSEKDTPHIADMFGKRLESSLLGNFPGAEIKKLPHDKLNAGVIPVLKDIKKSSVAIVSNIASEKSEKFISQSMEKLIDGIVPSSELEEYTIVLLATPVKEQLERKNALSELYSKLAPFSTWSTTFTLSETTAVGSSATFGANLGGSAGRQIGDTATTGTNSSRGTTDSNSTAHTDSTNNSTTDGTNSSTSSGTSDSTKRSITLKKKFKIAFAQCIDNDDKIFDYSEYVYGFIQNRPDCFTINHATIKTVEEMIGFVNRNRDADILYISAHGWYKKDQNIAGIAIGSDIWMANENLVFPPVVILSACHVSPRGRGAVCISDLIMRNGAIAVLGQHRTKHA